MGKGIVGRAAGDWRQHAGIIAACCAVACNAVEPDERAEKVADIKFALSRASGGARRLTAAQYQRTIADILGPEAGAAAAAPVEPVVPIVSVNAFEAPVSRSFVLGYESSAIAAAAQAVAFPARLAQHAPCVTQGPVDAAFRRACYQQVAHRIGFLAFRKPPLAALKERLVSVGVAGEEEATSAADKLKSGVKYVLASILQAPSFLYSVEVGSPSGVASEFNLNGFELASRLALFLLGKNPPEELLERAAAGELSTPSGVRAVAAELLASADARNGLIDQLDETFQLKLLASKGKNPTLFPDYDAELKASMREETQRFILDFVFDAPRNFIGVLNEEQRFVNARLAEDVYGITPPGSGWQRVDFSVAPLDQQVRAGLMTMPAMLTILSHSALNSITRRGLFVMGSLLCQDTPTVPRVVDTTLHVAPDGTLREFMESGPGVCGATCHGRQDPMAFAFENFDAIGRFRTTETTPNGTVKSVDPTVMSSFEMFNGQIFPAYADAREWADNIADPAYGFSACMIKHMYRNAVGASAGADQAAAIAGLDASFASSGYLFTEVLLDFVSSPLFTQVGSPR